MNKTSAITGALALISAMLLGGAMPATSAENCTVVKDETIMRTFPDPGNGVKKRSIHKTVQRCDDGTVIVTRVKSPWIYAVCEPCS